MGQMIRLGALGLSILYILLVPRFVCSNNDVERIIFLGDSLTAGGRWGEYFKSEGQEIKNFGIIGDTTRDVLNRLDLVILEKPNKLFLMVGINDAPSWKTFTRIVRNYNFILKAIRAKSPGTKIYVQSILPVNNDKSKYEHDNENIKEVNQELKKMADRWSAVYIDLYRDFDSGGQLNGKYTDDGLHLNKSGYSLWVRLIDKYVRE